jgi:shikimate kinase
LQDQAKPFFHILTGKNVKYKNVEKYIETNKNINKLHFTGYMGSGKSTIGKIIANDLEWEFIDIDEYIIKYENMDIADIFRIKGEDHFRKIESKIIQDQIKKDKIVISSGGGAIMDPTSFNILKDNAFNVYLSSEIKTMFDRSFEYFRPLHANDENKFEKFYKDREDQYFIISDLIANSELNPELAARKIFDDIKRLI